MDKTSPSKAGFILLSWDHTSAEVGRPFGDLVPAQAGTPREVCPGLHPLPQDPLCLITDNYQRGEAVLLSLPLMSGGRLRESNREPALLQPQVLFFLCQSPSKQKIRLWGS